MFEGRSSFRPQSCLSCSTYLLGHNCIQRRPKKRRWYTGGSAFLSPSYAAAAEWLWWQWGRWGESSPRSPPAWAGRMYLGAWLNSPTRAAPPGHDWGTMAAAGWSPCGRFGPERCAGCWCPGCFQHQCPWPEAAQKIQRPHGGGEQLCWAPQTRRRCDGDIPRCACQCCGWHFLWSERCRWRGWTILDQQQPEKPAQQIMIHPPL